jgi:hypothetical protein
MMPVTVCFRHLADMALGDFLVRFRRVSGHPVKLAEWLQK